MTTVLTRTDVPHVAWGDFLPRFRWHQGEHVALIGPTGTGKTTLALQLLPRRQWNVILATKPKDATLRGLSKHGYKKVTSWPHANPTQNRVVLWPGWRSPLDTPKQRAVLGGALLNIFESGSWSIFADDVQYLTDELALGRILRTMWLQARSLGISVVAATQRPRRAPVEMFNQSTHLFFWQTADREDLARIGGLGGLDSRMIRELVADLPKHHALYVNTRDRKLAITRAEKG